MAAVPRVYTVHLAAKMLGRDEYLIWSLSGQLEPEDGRLWIYDVDGIDTRAFSDRGIEVLRESIADQIIRAE